jgi:hypothetical protein
MRCFTGILLCAVTAICTAQQTRYCLPSPHKAFTGSGLTLLITKNTSKAFLKDPARYRDLTKVELKNLDEPELVISSLKSLVNIEEITFNGCDLEGVQPDFASLYKLRRLSIKGNASYDKNLLCKSLRNNACLEELELCCETDIDLPDSLCFLKSLKQLSLVNLKARPDLKGKSYRSSVNYTIAPGVFNTISISASGFEKPAVALQDDAKEFTTLHGFNNSVIRPPVSGININDTSYLLNSSRDNVVNYCSGSILFIPKNSFVTQDNKTYQGDVKVFYREFRNPVDIMLSGIPMTNSEGADTNLFQSAGMYELWAFDEQNNKLNLKPEKQINISFKPTAFSDSAEYNLYTLDTLTGNWGKPEQNVDLKKGRLAVKTSMAITEFLFNRRKTISQRPDLTAFNDRFYSSDYIGTIHKKNIKLSDDQTNYTLTKYAPEQKFKSRYKFRSVRKTKKGELLFKMSRNPSYHPSYKSDLGGQPIHLLENKILKYMGPELSKVEFKNMYQKKIFHDVRLTNTGNGLLITLKDKDGLIDLPFQVVSFDKEEKEYVELTKLEAYLGRTFRNRVNRDSRIHDRKHVKRRNRMEYDYIFETTLEFTPREAYEKARKFMSEEEQAMSYEAFVMRADSAEILSNASNGTQVLGTFNPELNEMVSNTNNVLINSGLGFKNIDAYIHKGLVKEVYAFYKNPETDKTVKTDFTSTIIFGINTSINNLNTGTTDEIKMRYIKGKRFMIVRIDNQGYMQADRNKDFEIKDEIIQLPLANNVYIKDKSSREIAALLGL